MDNKLTRNPQIDKLNKKLICCLYAVQRLKQISYTDIKLLATHYLSYLTYGQLTIREGTLKTCKKF